MEQNKPRVFWDSSGIITAVFSSKPHSDARQILQLGNLGFVDMRYCRDVVRDVQFVVSKYRPELIPELALTLDQANFSGESAEPAKETIDVCFEMTSYRPDARVLACAVECDADIFVTTDKQHFLGNPLIGPPNTRCRVMTPREALEWTQEEMRRRAQENG
ncbi:MAG: hypothetical protein ACRYFS_07895 [Janthinobacterium lividum]